MSIGAAPFTRTPGVVVVSPDPAPRSLLSGRMAAGGRRSADGLRSRATVDEGGAQAVVFHWQRPISIVFPPPPPHRRPGSSPAGNKMTMTHVPSGLRPPFQEYDPQSLDLDGDADLIIQPILGYRIRDEIRWLFASYGADRVRAFARVRGERMRSRVPLNDWRKQAAWLHKAPAIGIMSAGMIQVGVTPAPRRPAVSPSPPLSLTSRCL